MASSDDGTVWLPAVCEHGCRNNSGIVKLMRGVDYRFDNCYTRKGSRRFKYWHVANEDAAPDNRLELPKKPRRKRSDAGVKRGARSGQP